MPVSAEDNWRIDPFVGTLNAVVRSETHTVEQFSAFGNRYGVQVDFGILFENPSSVSISGFTEVGFAAAPSVGQFRVDYDPLRADGTSITTIRYKNTAFIEFNPASNGASVTVNYKGTGRVVKAQNWANLLANTTIPVGLAVDGNFRIAKSSNYTFSSAGNETFDGDVESLFLKTGGTGTFTLSNISEGQAVNILVSSTGSAYTITWAGYTFRWIGATVPIPTEIASRFDLYVFRRLGGEVYGSLVRGFG